MVVTAEYTASSLLGIVGSGESPSPFIDDMDLEKIFKSLGERAPLLSENHLEEQIKISSSSFPSYVLSSTEEEIFQSALLSSVVVVRRISR